MQFLNRAVHFLSWCIFLSVWLAVRFLVFVFVALVELGLMLEWGLAVYGFSPCTQRK